MKNARIGIIVLVLVSLLLVPKQAIESKWEAPEEITINNGERFYGASYSWSQIKYMYSYDPIASTTINQGVGHLHYCHIRYYSAMTLDIQVSPGSIVYLYLREFEHSLAYEVEFITPQFITLRLIEK